MRKTKLSSLSDLVCSILVIIAILAIALGISWICTVGIVYLITLCFHLKFTWLIATGIWLVLLLLSSVFSVTVKK